tara:strand:- start:1271 stop:1651 length:381 start_codon:yes stop_codon:yes gene_type:complete
MIPAPVLAEGLRKRLDHFIVEREEGKELSPKDRTLLLAVLMSTADSLEGSNLVTEYSGRCMYDATCVGIVCKTPDSFAFALAAACFDMNEDPRKIQALLGTAAQDSMGMRTILYWPRLETNPPRDA